MFCPNCGLDNAAGAKFCSNCGTPFVSAPGESPSQYQYQGTPQYPQYPSASTPQRGSSVGKNIALGCLIAIVIFMFLGLSCTRACLHLGHRRTYVYRNYF